MKSAIVAVLCVAFAIRTSGQTVPVVITSDYYAQPKVLVLHALNNSGEDITGYTIIIRHKNADGTVEQSGRTERSMEMLSVLVRTQMAKDAAASERIRQENTGHVASSGTVASSGGVTLNASGTGIFLASAGIRLSSPKLARSPRASGPLFPEVASE
jgi:hypothetical protein